MTHHTPTRQLSFLAIFLCIAFSLTACSQRSISSHIENDPETASGNQPLKKLYRVPPRLLDKSSTASTTAKKAINTKSDTTNNLTGSIAGDWDDVTGWISFPYDDGFGELSVLVRGLEGTKQTGDEYSFSGWDGEVFWINVGDGIPRLLAAKLENNTFIPTATDAFTQSGKLYSAGYVLYRQAGVSYSLNEWANGAVLGDLLFVIDNNDQVVEIVVEVYNDDGELIEKRILAAGDQLQMLTHAYKLNEPDQIYLLEYMDYKQISGQPSIEKAHYQPNVDFTDTDLLVRASDGFDSSTLQLELLVDAARLTAQDTVEFAFNTPQDLGYTWGEAKQAFNTNTSSNGGGSFDWLLLLLAGLGVARLIIRREKMFTHYASVAVVLCIAFSLTACAKVPRDNAELIPPELQRFLPLYRDKPSFLNDSSNTPSLSGKDINITSNRSDNLTASITGDWEDVTGWISFPYDDGNGGLLYVLARGLEATKQTGDEYSFSGWDGEVFWIDMGDGVPRLLPAKLISSSYVPQGTDTFTQSGTLYEAGYVLYRQAGVSYPVDEWADEAVLGDLLFVTDANDQVLEIAIDIYNDDSEFIERRVLEAGDQLQMLTHAYNLNEPDSVYLLEYMDYKQLNGQPSIEKAHYQPNVDFTDADLQDRAGEAFDTSAIKLQLLVDAVRLTDQDEVEFAFSTPKDLGYTWGEAKQVLNTTASSSGGGAFDWLLILLAGLGSARLIMRRK